jgi:hypothetical protein
MLKIIFKSLLVLLLLGILLLAGAYYALQKESVQTWLTKKVTGRLSEKLQTKVTVDKIKIDFLNHLNLEGAFIADKKNDTLLYAGQLQFKITDWFFIKKEIPEISYIKLTDAVVNLTREKSSADWNYNFIHQVFASNDTTDSKPLNSDAKNNLEFQLKNILLKNVRFKSIDRWQGQDLITHVGSLNLDAKQLDLKDKKIQIEGLQLSDIQFIFNEYDGGKPKTPKSARDTSRFNPGWNLALADLKLNSINFTYNANAETSKKIGFDEEHIYASNLNAAIKNINIIGDTLIAKIISLTGKERCNLEIKQLVGDVILNPNKTLVNNLVLQTNNSIIRNRYEMVYNNFTDFNDYINKVQMNATFKNSHIDFKDIAYFGEEINQIPIKSVQLNTGSFSGTVKDFKSTNLNIIIGKSSIVGDLNMKGLPNINKTLIFLNARNLQTSGAEIIKYIPAANTPAVSWQKLSSINYKGNYRGYISDFITDGVLITNQGTVINKLHFVFPNNKNIQPSYDGYFSTTNLLLGNIIKESNVGLVSASGKIKGEGFDFENINMHINANVNKLQTANYTYEKVSLDGVFANKTFTGKLISDDPNMLLGFDGVLNFSEPLTKYNFKSKVTHLNLKSLGLSNENILASAIMDVNFTGTNLDNFIGIAKLKNVHVARGKEKFYLEDIELESRPKGNSKFFSVKSSALDATLNGKFKVVDLPMAMQYYLSNYLPEYIKKPKNVNPQQFDFVLHTKEVDPLLKTFAPEFLGSNELHLIGNLDMFKQNLNLNIQTPFFKYKNVGFENISIQSNGNFDSLVSSGTTGKLIVNNNEILPSSIIYANIGNDTADIKITTIGGSYNVSDAVLEVKGFSKKNIFYANILPSSFNLKDKQWNLYSEPYIQYDHGKLLINKLTLENGLQKIEAHTTGLNHENLEAAIANIDLAEINAFANNIDATESEIEGRANGVIVVNNFLKKRAISGNINTTDILYLKDTIGKIIGNISYDEAEKLLTVDNNSGVIFRGNHSEIYGSINMAGEDPILDLHAVINQMPIQTFEPFLSGFIANTQGITNGVIDVKGGLKSYDMNGHINIEKVKTHVVYLGTTYTIPFAKIEINNSLINLGNFNIYDSLNNVAKVKGVLTHNRLENIRFKNVNISSNPDPFMFLNTDENSEELYYGYVIARGSLMLNGSFDDLNMELLVKTLKGTHLYLPIKSDFDGSNYDFIKFKTAYETTTQEKIKQKNKLRLNMVISATPDAQLSVIVDPTTGESIEGKGEGFITMDIDLDKPPKFGGVYVIKNGIYNYNFRGLIPKKLKIDEGGTINFDEAQGGNPLKAKLNITARYGLKADIGKYQGNGPGKIMQTEVIIQIKNEMLAPDFDFAIVQPENTEINSEEYKSLVDINSDKQKKMEQIGSLLFFDRFNPNSAANTTVQLQTDLINQISSVVAPTLSNVLTNSLENMLGIKGYNFDIKYQNLGAIGDNSRSQLQVNINKSFFNDRLTFEVGPSYDFVKSQSGSTSTTGATSKLNTNWKINYLFKNNLSAKIFHLEINDNYNNNRQHKNGIGLVYTKQFTDLRELFFLKPNKDLSYIEIDTNSVKPIPIAIGTN